MVLESVRARYTMGPAIIKHVHEVAQRTISKTLECIRTEPEETCIDNHFKPAFDLSRFKQWLNNNVKTPDRVEKSPFVFVCDANKSQYQVFSCNPWLLTVAETKIADSTKMYDMIDSCFPLLNDHVPADSDIVVYSGFYKISYNTVSGTSFTEFQDGGAKTTYNCPANWSPWLLANIQSMHNAINNAADCHATQSASQSIISSMRTACTEGKTTITASPVVPASPTQPSTDPVHPTNTLLLQCDTVKSHCIVLDCNSPTDLNDKDYNVRAQCQAQSINNDNNAREYVDVVIVKDNNPAQRFQCIDGWAKWVMSATKQDPIDIQVADKHITNGCKNISPEQPVNQPQNEGNDTHSSSQVPLIIGVSTFGTLTMLGAAIAAFLYKKNLLQQKQPQMDIEQAIPKPEISTPKFYSSTNQSLDQLPSINGKSEHITGQGPARPSVPSKPKHLQTKLEKASNTPLAPLQEATELQEPILENDLTFLRDKQIENANLLIYASVPHSSNLGISSLPTADNMQPLLGVDSK
ncbi:hypothetical protein [Candidatus Tisiphia endosymbiont of Beris chalybata]|uniref:hypothetical protein n=1 Tax=Candidatus Tisiphia endosymbiont of Beris chalybata TaxID=3066262 RepID=UPI00312C8340